MMALNRGVKSPRSWALRQFAMSNVVICRRFHPAPRPRSTSSRTKLHADESTLGEPVGQWRRPVFKYERKLHRRVDQSRFVNFGQQNVLRTKFDRYLSEGWLKRLVPSTNYTFEPQDIEKPDGLDSELLFLRCGCYNAWMSFSPVKTEMRVRKLCAKTQDLRYHKMYHSLESQAHNLYLLGRVELERDPVWRPFARYMLSISAGLGQLDAALLLHQLEKHDQRFSLDDEQRELITRAARSEVDWRAMVAHCEHIVSEAKGRNGKGKVPAVQLDECLDLLAAATRLTRPAPKDPGEGARPPGGRLDVQRLEEYEPPYKLMQTLTANQLLQGNRSKDIFDRFEVASRQGALEYRDPEAAGLYVELKTAGRDNSTEWVACASMAAAEGNADSCFRLARHYLKRDGWYPTLASKILGRTRHIERRYHLAVDTNSPAEIVIHDEIVSQKNDALLRVRDGLQWMKKAALLHVDSAGKMLNRYCIVVGLLRLNGFLAEGREALQEARTEISDCHGDPREKARALQVAGEYLEFWDQRLAHQLLETEDVDRLLSAV